MEVLEQCFMVASYMMIALKFCFYVQLVDLAEECFCSWGKKKSGSHVKATNLILCRGISVFWKSFEGDTKASHIPKICSICVCHTKRIIPALGEEKR